MSRAVRTPPQARDWLEALLAAVAFAGVAALIGQNSGLMSWAPRSPTDIALLAARSLLIPALGEELVFRAALVPSRGDGVKPAPTIALSTVAFTLWHVVETTFLPWSAATFLRPDFLVLAALLGLCCAILRWRSGSIWTAVALHWLIVVVWQGFLGGPSFGV
jgi:predicted Abi (CAAX) family protease